MPITSHLTNLVFGEKKPDFTLLEQGVIPVSWFFEFEAALDAEIQASTGSTWSRNLVQASHWVSFYLPMRVRVASHTIGVSRAISKQVFDLHIKIEQKLLLNLTHSIDRNNLEAFSAKHPLTHPELEIIRLSLGNGNPIAAHYDSPSIVKWREDFETNWKVFALTLQTSTHWDKCSIIAIRVASFYWDVFFSQNIPLPESFNSDFPNLRSVFPLSTLALIHAVLHPPDEEIDEAGLPIIGPRIQTSKLSVRRLIEPVIMARSPNEL